MLDLLEWAIDIGIFLCTVKLESEDDVEARLEGLTSPGLWNWRFGWWDLDLIRVILIVAMIIILRIPMIIMLIMPMKMIGNINFMRSKWLIKGNINHG